MARMHARAAVLCMVVAGLTGCTEARYLSKGPTTKVVAVKMDGWLPTDYHAAAVGYARDNDPNFKEADILREGEVVIGKQTENSEVKDTRPLDQNGKPIGELSTRNSVSTTTPIKEYHLEYRVPAKLMGNNTLPSQTDIVQTGATMKPAEMKPAEMKPTGRTTTPTNGPALTPQAPISAPFGPSR